ncbi:radiation-inducible immediate-early gene IEX-1 [Micropterus dolomieu]|uniref:radiation-inducible immediate-early gene IEX-1 n=1 Tax=Micropterus dolomieu TaxID=147949 RepID=UPI001E8DA593|nr:radiation-inducible immediate-early gene IEX-1 [Micropterus dolomieu]
MYSRSDSVTLTVKRESFALSRMATRSTEPEVFTFERIPTQATAVHSYVPIRPKKRCTRVMYPAKVRMHLPPPEKSQAKRWLVILCLVVLWQIYTEEPCAETSLDSSDSDYMGFPFQSAEEQALQLSELSASSELLSASPTNCEKGRSSSEQIIPNTTCAKPGEETETSPSFEQSAGKSYMVALLVYHRLGSEN